LEVFMGGGEIKFEGNVDELITDSVVQAMFAGDQTVDADTAVSAYLAALDAQDTPPPPPPASSRSCYVSKVSPDKGSNPGNARGMAPLFVEKPEDLRTEVAARIEDGFARLYIDMVEIAEKEGLV
jgi:hypothetical protein